jgi:hypothetical protein
MSRQAKIIVAAVIAVLLLSTVGAAIFVGGGDSSSNKQGPETVHIEVRSFPAMTIKKDGRELGQTPVSFIVAKSTKPIALDAEWVEQRVYRDHTAMVPRQAHKDIVPDRSMTVDFKKSDAKPLSTE